MTWFVFKVPCTFTYKRLSNSGPWNRNFACSRLSFSVHTDSILKMTDVCLGHLLFPMLLFASVRAQNCPAAPFPGCGAAGQCSGECISGVTVPTVLGCQVPNDCTNGYCVTNVCLTVSADATSCGGRCVPATGGAQTYCINGVCLQATGTACTGKCRLIQEYAQYSRFGA